ncbi:MAG: hypothetical protein ABR538_06205 [Candidatus Binatia bacterium]
MSDLQHFGEGICFVPLASPDAQEVACVLADTTARVVRAYSCAGSSRSMRFGASGAMRIVAAVREPRAVAAFFACIGKGAGRPPPA